MADSGCEDTIPTMVPSCKLPEESDASMRARLFTSLSQSFPHSQLYKALHGGEDINLNGGENSEDDDDSLYGDHLSNSCFASLRMDRRDSDDFDDDLRSLEWLQNEDLLKNIGGEKLDKEDDDNEEQKENEDIKPDINLLQAAVGQPPPHIPYLPQKHVNSKPPYSFSCLIFMAVEASPQKRLPVKDIYNWILTQFPYFQNAPTGWKNSVRHNLSLNKCFKKVEKDKGQSIGKGSLWCIDPAYRPNLLQALRKTPYHPYHQLQMTSTQPQNYMQYQSLPGGGRTVLPLTQRPVPNTVSPHLFPFLSRRLAQTSFDVDNEMKDVAQTLVALKGSYKKEPSDNSPGEDTGPTWRNHKRSFKRSSSPVVVTGHPYDDHAYSSTRLLDDDVPSPSSSSSIDEEYDFGDADEECESDYQSDMEWDSDSKDEVDGDLPSSKKLKIDIREDAGSSSHANKGAATSNESEDDEQKKIHEGASALLNLAGLLMSSRGSGIKPEAGGARKKKATTGDKDKKGEKKKRVVKQQKNVVKKSSTSASQKEEATVEEKSQRKRSVSKRKNAGSNGKYDNDEYSVSLPGKSTAKSRSSSSSSPKSTKTKVARSSSSKESVESGTTSKTKASVKGGSSTKIIKKGSIGKKKLKLSKSFGTMKKHASVMSDKNNLGVDGTKLKKIATKKVQRQAHYAKKDLPRNRGSSIPRKSKSNSEESDVTKSVSQSQMSSDNSKPAESTDKVNNNNNNNVVKDEGMSIGEEKPTAVHEEQVVSNVDPSKAESKKIGDEQLGKTTATLVNGEIISPAGDAPACPLETQALAADDKSEKLVESKASVQSSPTTSNSNSSSGDAKESSDKVLGAKISPNSKSSSSSLASTPAAVSSHKSPHFTRFSKKKAAIS